MSRARQKSRSLIELTVTSSGSKVGRGLMISCSLNDKPILLAFCPRVEPPRLLLITTDVPMKVRQNTSKRVTCLLKGERP